MTEIRSISYKPDASGRYVGTCSCGTVLADDDNVCPTCDPSHKLRQFTLVKGRAVCVCGEPMTGEQWFSETLVGYGYGPCGSSHDDNCRKKVYRCPNGHSTTISIVRTCLRCDWTGKRTCFCHPGEKVKRWPK